MSPPFDLWIVHPDAAVVNAARKLEARVFLEAFGNTEDELEREYGPFGPSSLYVAVTRHKDGNHAVGMMRVIRWGPAGLKTVHDASSGPWGADLDRLSGLVSPETALDVATLAIAPSDRRGADEAAPIVLGVLMFGFYRMCRLLQASEMVAILDDKVLAHLREWGVDLEPFPGTEGRPYLGSPSSTPVFASVDHLPSGFKAKGETWRAFVEDGVGLEGELADVHVDLGTICLRPQL